MRGHHELAHPWLTHTAKKVSLDSASTTRNGVRRPSYECSDRGIVGAAAPAAFDDVIEGGEFPEIRL